MLTRSTASNLQQVAKANSASYPQGDDKLIVAYLVWATEWRPDINQSYQNPAGI